MYMLFVCYIPFDFYEMEMLYCTSQRKQKPSERARVLWFGLVWNLPGQMQSTQLTRKRRMEIACDHRPPVDVLCLQVIPSLSFFHSVICSFVRSFDLLELFDSSKQKEISSPWTFSLSLLDILRIYSHFNVNETKWPVDKSVHIHQKSHRCISCQMYLLLI